jgi:hypothetical protein
VSTNTAQFDVCSLFPVKKSSTLAAKLSSFQLFSLRFCQLLATMSGAKKIDLIMEKEFLNNYIIIISK